MQRNAGQKHPLPHAAHEPTGAVSRHGHSQPRQKRTFFVTVFVTGAESQTLPLKVYGMVRVGLNPQLNALSALGIILTMVLVFASERLKQPAKGKVP